MKCRLFIKIDLRIFYFIFSIVPLKNSPCWVAFQLHRTCFRSSSGQKMVGGGRAMGPPSYLWSFLTSTLQLHPQCSINLSYVYIAVTSSSFLTSTLQLHPQCSFVNLGSTTTENLLQETDNNRAPASYFHIALRSTEEELYNFAIGARNESFCSIVVADLRNNKTFWSQHQSRINSILEIVKTKTLVVTLNEPVQWINLTAFTSKTVILTG